MSGSHALFSPSSAHRIALCPASLLRTKDIVDAPNWYAVEGTIGHAIHEYGLLHPQWGISRFLGMRPNEFMQPTEMLPEEWALVPQDWVVTQDFLDAIQRSIEWCLEYEGEHYVEQRVNISKYTPVEDQFGTCDHACIVPCGLLVITDLKMGQGVKVYADHNPQLALYALGFIEEHDWLHAFDRVLIRVSQPRLGHFDVWETTADELRYMGAYLKQRFTLALQPDAPFGPDEKACQFCKFKPKCPALFEKAHAAAAGWFDDLSRSEIAEVNVPKNFPISTPDAKALTVEQMAIVLDNAKLLRDFIDAVEEHALHLLLHGTQVPNRKLVEGRSVRTIVDVSGYETLLREHGINPHKQPELIGITDAEKALGKAKTELAQYLSKPRGKPTIAHVSDKREPYTLTAGEMFSDESSPP